jgi:ATP-binding cassette, subfamily C, bacterial
MLIDFIRELIRFARVKVITAGFLFILLGLTQGVGLVLIIPFLSLLGLPGEVGGFTAFVVKTAASLGLPLNLYTLFGLYLVIVSIFAFLNRFQAVLNVDIQQQFIRSWRNRLYRALTYADWLFISREKSSDVTHALTSDLQQVGGGTLLLLQFSSSLVLALFHLAVAVLLSLPLTGMTLVFGAVIVVFMRPLTRQAFETGAAHRSSRQELYAAAMEHLTGMKTAKSYGVEQQHIQRIDSINRAIAARVLEFTKARSSTRLYYEISAAVFLCGFFWIALELLKVPAARLLLLAFIFIRLLPRLAMLQQQYQNIKNMLPAFSGIRELYDRARTAEEPGMTRPGEPLPLRQAVSFRSVWFRYSQDHSQYALEDASFYIPAQKITAVMGPSGAGKSTLADLLLGLLRPEKGSLRVDQEEITAHRLCGWRHSIGYVPQETFLFHDTLRANLLWASPSASEEELWDVLRLAAAEDFVKSLPNGLDTVCGDRGSTLSGGERQRVALARALLRKPQLLLLDEATSALDSRNEQRIQHAIRSLRGKLTIVIIAHRFSTLRHAEHIILLEGGRVKETGSWEALSGNDKSYLSRMIAAEKAKI